MIRARPGFTPRPTIQPLTAPPIGGGIVRAFAQGMGGGLSGFYNNASSNPNHFVGQQPGQPVPPTRSPEMTRPAPSLTGAQLAANARAKIEAMKQMRYSRPRMTRTK